MARNGGIPKEQLNLPYKPFAVMGGLDAIAGIMQVFAATYLPGPLIILLVSLSIFVCSCPPAPQQQSAIPISMVISKYMINAQYNTYQYVGAAIVAVGIVVVLAPTISGGGSIVWAMVMMVSCVPMTLSSVYKVSTPRCLLLSPTPLQEISLGETELDAVGSSSLGPPIVLMAHSCL
jgi:hypothetical protein